MKYIRVDWTRDYADDPIVIFSEVDDSLWEHRKIEVFRDGRQGFADANEECGDTILGEKPWPDLALIAADPEFKLTELSAPEFESLWARRRERVASIP